MSNAKYAAVKVRPVENPDDPPIEDLDPLPKNETEVETTENLPKEVVRLPPTLTDMKVIKSPTNK